MSSLTTGEIPPAGGALPAIILPPYLRKPRLRRWEASEYLERVHGITVATSTLAKYATIGGGPAYNKSKTSRTPLYPTSELDAWAEKRLGKLVRSTSEIENDHGAEDGHPE